MCQLVQIFEQILRYQGGGPNVLEILRLLLLSVLHLLACSRDILDVLDVLLGDLYLSLGWILTLSNPAKLISPGVRIDGNIFVRALKAELMNTDGKHK